jgi:large subunit ribosomal protein L6
MVRALINNAVNGVSRGFTRGLEISGVGYRAEVKGQNLVLSLGFSHPVDYAIPQGIKIVVQDQTKIAVTGCDRELVGKVASEIRKFKKPEPYKGKGIKYAGEHIIRKVGKTAAAAGAPAGGK